MVNRFATPVVDVGRGRDGCAAYLVVVDSLLALCAVISRSRGIPYSWHGAGPRMFLFVLELRVRHPSWTCYCREPPGTAATLPAPAYFVNGVIIHFSRAPLDPLYTRDVTCPPPLFCSLP